MYCAINDSEFIRWIYTKTPARRFYRHFFTTRPATGKPTRQPTRQMMHTRGVTLFPPFFVHLLFSTVRIHNLTIKLIKNSIYSHINSTRRTGVYEMFNAPTSPITATNAVFHFVTAKKTFSASFNLL